jgi:hypothetical protein
MYDSGPLLPVMVWIHGGGFMVGGGSGVVVSPVLLSLQDNEGIAADVSHLPQAPQLDYPMWQVGSGSETVYQDPSQRLVKLGNVVLVTINYRLGVLGFLKVEGGDLNCGLWDQVRDNGDDDDDEDDDDDNGDDDDDNDDKSAHDRKEGVDRRLRSETANTWWCLNSVTDICWC